METIQNVATHSTATDRTGADSTVADSTVADSMVTDSMTIHPMKADESSSNESSLNESSSNESLDTPKSEERLFTQAEVDTIVTERLNQERKKFEEIKREAEDRDRKISKTHEALDTSARNLTEAFLSAVSPEIAALLKKLSLPDQLDWFAEHGAKPVPRLQAPIINDIGGKNAKKSPEAEEDRLKELRARFRIDRSH